MKKLILSLAALVILGGCSCDSGSVPGRVRDKKAYELGREHGEDAVALVENENELQDKLLEIRARRTNIESHLGAQSARDYEAGFTDYIRENSDSLYTLLF